VSYNLKELFDYCKQKGVKQPSELSEEELKRFEIYLMSLIVFRAFIKPVLWQDIKNALKR